MKLKDNLFIFWIGAIAVLFVISTLLIAPLFKHYKMLYRHAKNEPFNQKHSDSIINRQLLAKVTNDETIYIQEDDFLVYPVSNIEETKSTVDLIGSSLIFKYGNKVVLEQNRMPYIYGKLITEGMVSEAQEILSKDKNTKYYKFLSLVERSKKLKDIALVYNFIDNHVLLSDNLVRAKQAYDVMYGAKTFITTTIPKYDDSNISWESSIIIMDQESSNLNGYIFLSKTDSIPASLKEYRRIALIDLNRKTWYKQEIVDDFKANSIFEDYFGFNGLLREVPKKLVIEFNEYLEITLVSKNDRNKLKNRYSENLTFQSLDLHGGLEISCYNFKDINSESNLKVSANSYPKWRRIIGIICSNNALN